MYARFAACEKVGMAVQGLCGIAGQQAEVYFEFEEIADEMGICEYQN